MRTNRPGGDDRNSDRNYPGSQRPSKMEEKGGPNFVERMMISEGKKRAKSAVEAGISNLGSMFRKALGS